LICLFVCNGASENAHSACALGRELNLVK